LQRGGGRRAAGCGALAALLFLVSQAHAPAARNAATPPAEEESALDCTKGIPAPSVTDAAVTLSPSRGWQMAGREIKVTIRSANLPAEADAKPSVCFSWKFRDHEKRNFVPVDSVRMVQQCPEGEQPCSKPGALTFAAPVPVLPIEIPGANPNKPDKSLVEYTPYDQYAPVAEVRILMRGRDRKPIDVVAPVAVVNDQDYCNVPIGQGVGIDSGTIIPSRSKNWQPVGGEIEFTAKSAKAFPSDALIRVCFRWRLTNGEHYEFNDSGPIHILDVQRNATPSTLKLAVGVPELYESQPPGRSWWRSLYEALQSADDVQAVDGNRIGSYAFGGLVPETDVRTLVFDKDLNPVFDTAGKIGVTNTGLAWFLAIFTVSLAFAFLHWVSRQQFPDVRNPFLGLITTPRGTASLSRFQILLWTFVVMTSSVYVIALAGDLITITPGTLVLLGISGAAAVLDKMKEAGLRDRAAAVPALPPPAGQAVTRQQARAPADAQPAGGPVRRPRWSDLILDENTGNIDVSRVQMLIFTLVTAAFVAIKVISSTNYEIPDIPAGFLILMGISNGVYVGSKFAGP
jgi:hypothetical protein